MIHAMLNKLNTVPPTPFLFSYSGAGWSRATFHRQVEVCTFHHNLPFWVGEGDAKREREEESDLIL